MPQTKKASTFVKEKLVKIKLHTEPHTPLSPIDMPSRQKRNREIMKLKEIMYQI